MRFLIAAVLILSCSLCFAEDLQKDYRKLKSLTVEQASYLAATSRGALVLKSLTSIDKDVAHELAKESKYLTLSGLTSIDKDVAQELGNSKDLILYGLTSIDKNVAKGLAKCVGTLNLNGLTSIDKDVAQELGKRKGSLYVANIISIDKDVAQGLAKCTGWLNLSGLTSIDKDVAQELVKFKGSWIALPSQALIDKEVLEILDLNSKISIPKKWRDLIRDQQPDEKPPEVKAAVGLCQDARPQFPLDLSYIEEISAEDVAYIIDKAVSVLERELVSIWTQRTLWFDGLKNIDESVATELVKFGAGRSLYLGIHTVSAPVLEILTGFDDVQPKFSCYYNLTFTRLEALPPGGIETLLKWRGRELTLPSEIEISEEDLRIINTRFHTWELHRVPIKELQLQVEQSKLPLDARSQIKKGGNE